MLLPLIDAIYWLTLSAWFGAVLVSAMIPPIIHKTINDADPTLPLVLSVNLDKQHSILLAGGVVSEILKMLFRLEAICALVFLPALVGKWFMVDVTGPNVIMPLMVTALYLISVAFVLYGWRVVYPKVIRHRERYIENADDPDIANAELDSFDRYSIELFAVVRNLLFSLLGAVLFSAALPPYVQRLTAS